MKLIDFINNNIGKKICVSKILKYGDNYSIYLRAGQKDEILRDWKNEDIVDVFEEDDTTYIKLKHYEGNW